MVQTSAATLFLAGADVISVENVKPTKTTSVPQRPRQVSYSKLHIVWRNVIGFMVLHSLAFYGLYTIKAANKATVIYMLLTAYFAAEGITTGAHRLWSHKCYKAKWPLRFLLMFLQTTAFQNHIYEWVRDHRVHHKYTDTDADPHNSRRGFFFSHMGWLLVKKHPDVMAKGKLIDMSDLEKDPIVMWQKKYYSLLVLLCTFLIPTLIPYYMWNETFGRSFLCCVLRYILSLHATWLVNSAAHMWGMKPYDKNISAAENLTVTILTFGEGFHNYHHAFPWDYKAAELGNYSLNWSTGFIDLFAKIGWAYDMKMASKEIIMQRIKRTGDGSYQNESDVWGWDDKDMREDDKKLVTILNRQRGE